jgi:hypothetical protein
LARLVYRDEKRASGFQLEMSNVRYALTIGTLAASLTGCGASQPPIATPGALPQSPRLATHAAHGTSWMLPGATTQSLLYVSDVSEVVVYSYPQGRVAGRLRGFSIASGMCVDKAQNVYVADLNSVYKYAHGGTNRIKTLHPGDPLDCSVDPTTGDLAVTNLQGHGSSGNGSVAIYKGAGGKPTYYSAPGFWEYYFCGYDSKGNLYVDGLSRPGTGNFIFAELPTGSSTLKDITLNQYIGWPGGVQWDGQHVAVGDQTAPKIYEFDVGGSNGTLVGTTALDGAALVQQAWIQGTTLIAPDNITGHEGQVRFYKYPAGEKAVKILKGSVEGPLGATVSLVTNR